VVVDDADSGVTDVVRGDDLLASTGWQRSLQQALALPRPATATCHWVVDADGPNYRNRCTPFTDGDKAGAWLWRA